MAFAKSQLGTGMRMPHTGTIFVSVKDADKTKILPAIKQLVTLGFKLVATGGTQRFFEDKGVPSTKINKVLEGRPHIVDMLKNGEVSLVINTVEDRRNAIVDSREIRTSALKNRVPTFTPIFGAEAAIEGMRVANDLSIISVQEMHQQLA